MCTAAPTMAAIALLVLAQLHCCIAAHLAVVSQNSLIPQSLVSSVMDKLVNNYWRLPAFKTSPMSYQFIQASDAIEAMQKVCGASGLNGLVAAGSCQFVTDLMKLSSSIGVPTVAVSKDLCEFNTSNDMSLISTPRARHFLEAAAAVLSRVSAQLVAVFYDRFQDHQRLEKLQQLLSEVKIACVTFQIDDSSSNLTKILTNMVKSKIRYHVIMANSDNVRIVIQEALATQTLQINYFWTVIDSGIQLSSIEDLIPVNVTANILLVRESPVTLPTFECSGDIRMVFPDCQRTKHPMVELKTVEAMLSFANALQNMTDSSLAVSNATCQPLQPWLGGGSAVALMKQQRQPLSSLGNWLPGGYFLETAATFQAEIRDATKFVTSGRFFPENGSLAASFAFRNRLMLFPNTFVDFKNKTLRICSVDTWPYGSYSNGTPGGITNEFAKYFSFHLNFTFKMFPPPDNEFGAPAPNTTIFTGCVGMVQRGEADYAASFGITTTRSQAIEYAEDYLFTSNSILVKRPAPESKLWNVYTPLSWDSWVLILAMFVIVSIITYLFARFSPFSAWNLELPYTFADEVWLKEYVWSMIGSFLQQGQDFYPFAMSPRVVMAFWWMLTVIIFAAYTGDLTAKLTVSVAKYPIQSLDDLLSMPWYKAMVPKGTNIYAAIVSAPEGTPLAKLRNQMVIVDTFDICATNLVTMPDPYLVCVSEQIRLQIYSASDLCHQIYGAKAAFNPYFVGIGFPKDAYYLPAFRSLLQRGKVNGAVTMMVNKFVPSGSNCGSADNPGAEAAPIPLEGVGGAYLLALLLYIVGSLILLLELLWVSVLKLDPLAFPGF